MFVGFSKRKAALKISIFPLELLLLLLEYTYPVPRAALIFSLANKENKYKLQHILKILHEWYSWLKIMRKIRIVYP